METSIKPQIHKITRITNNNGKTKYLGMTYANNEVALEPGWIREKFEFREPEFYKLVTTLTCDETRHKTYTVPVGRCALHTSFMYVDRSLRGDAKKDKLIDELNFKKCMKLKRLLKIKFFVGITNKQRK